MPLIKNIATQFSIELLALYIYMFIQLRAETFLTVTNGTAYQYHYWRCRIGRMLQIQSSGKIDFIYCFYYNDSITKHNHITIFFLFLNTKSRRISKYAAVKEWLMALFLH